MKKKGNRPTEEEQALRKELEKYRKRGCTVCLNGIPSGPEKIIAACLREKGSYMRDYVSGEGEQIQRIDFIKIKEKK